MINLIYKKIVRFLLKTRLLEIYFGTENEADDFFYWLYPINHRKGEPSMKNMIIKICLWAFVIVVVLCLILMFVCYLIHKAGFE